MLAAALTDADEHSAALRGVPAAVRQALALEGETERLAGRYRDMQQCVVLGRGYNFATAMEWSLKLKELTYTVAERYSTAEFQHGPIALIEPGFPVLVVAPRDAGHEDTLALLARLAGSHGADLLVLSDNEAALAHAAAGLHLPAGIAPWLTPLVSIVPAQLFCYHLALARGLDPMQPRGLSKITRTQ